MHINLEDADIFSEILGSDDGKPILMIHGSWCDHRLMKGCMEPIFSNLPDRDSKWKRIYIDVPGMGDTILKREISSTDDIFNIIDKFVQKVFPKEVFYIAAESYGTYLARALVEKYPEQVGGIMMICPVAEPWPKNRDIPDLQITERDEKLYESLSVNEKNEFNKLFTIQNCSNWETFLNHVDCGKEKIDIKLLTKIRLYAYAFKKPLDENNFRFDKPSLIFAGRQDRVVGFKDQFSLLHNYTSADFILLNKAGHMLQIEQKEVFEYHVKRWLARL